MWEGVRRGANNPVGLASVLSALSVMEPPIQGMWMTRPVLSYQLVSLAISTRPVLGAVSRTPTSSTTMMRFQQMEPTRVYQTVRPTTISTIPMTCQIPLGYPPPVSTPLHYPSPDHRTTCPSQHQAKPTELSMMIMATPSHSWRITLCPGLSLSLSLVPNADTQVRKTQHSQGTTDTKDYPNLTSPHHRFLPHSHLPANLARTTRHLKGITPTEEETHKHSPYLLFNSLPGRHRHQAEVTPYHVRDVTVNIPRLSTGEEPTVNPGYDPAKDQYLHTQEEGTPV